MSSYIKPVLSSAWKVISWPLFGQSRKTNAFWAFLMTVALLTNVYAFKIGGTGWDMFWIVVSAMILGSEINNFIYNRHVQPDSPRYTEKEMDEIYHLLHETEMDNVELRREPAPRTDLSQASVAAALEAAANASEIAINSAYQSRRNMSNNGGFNAFMSAKEASIAAIRALITPAQHDALAAHVAAEVAKARAEDAATREVSADLLRRCRDELYLIRSKDCGAVYDITLRMELADAIAQIGAKP